MSWSRSDGMSRQVRSPATMSARIRSESSSRVVLRPCSRAAATSSALAAAMRANRAGSSNRRAKPSKKAVTAASGSRPSSRNAWWAAVTAASASAWSAAGIRSRAPVSCTTTSRSPGANSRARSSETLAIRSPPYTTGWPASSRSNRSDPGPATVTPCGRTGW